MAAIIATAACDRGAGSGAPPALAPTTNAPPREPPAAGQVRARTVYVPAYSHIPHGTGVPKPILLSILLSVRNIDPSSTITLTHVDYFDTPGHRVRGYLDGPRPLGPLETVEFSVDRFDEAGGSGANFLVDWEGPSDAHPILTEAVMLGHVGAGYLSFSSRGVELAPRTGPDVAPAPEGGNVEPARAPE